jgi:hypothetical protein
MDTLILYLLAGIIGVSNMIIWGLYGDLLIENFSYKKVLRSIFLGIVYSIFVFYVNSNLPLILVALIVIAFERATTEIYKALIRDERQEKYKIPSDLNVNFPRWIEKTVGVFLILLIAYFFMTTNFEINLLIIFIIASFLPALGGMMKDAPYEGFYPIKFFRSPFVILVVGFLLINNFSTFDQKYLLFSAWGGERLISEFYKKILNGKIPGKFKRDIHHHIKHSWKVERKILLIPYTMTVVALLTLIIFSI